jgi:hypothetical protein
VLKWAATGELKLFENILKLMRSFVSLNSRTSIILEEMKKNLTISIAEAAFGFAILRWVFPVNPRTVFVSRPFPFWVRR